MPTRDKDDRPADGQSQTGEVAADKAVFEHRRKIIKASVVAVPAIMTLRSGAAAAMASAYQCFNHGPDTNNIDLVLGDDENDPPHDEWSRMEAIPACLITGNNSKTYCGVKNANSSWTEAQDWDWWFIDENHGLTQAPSTSGNIKNGWANKTALYCIAGSANEPTVCWDERGANITSSIPVAILAKIEASDILVGLLVYYNPDNSVLTYYPMERGESLAVQPITESCLCSINPIDQLLN